MKITNHQGVTLVEALVTLILSSIVFGGIFFVVSEYHDMIEENLTAQQLQQEGAIITETVSRTVRNGKYVTINTDVTAPDVLRDTIKSINVYYPGGGSANLQIKNSTLMKDNVPIVAFSCDLTDETCFKVFPNGSRISFSISLEKVLNNKTYTYTNINEEVRCKNVNSL